MWTGLHVVAVVAVNVRKNTRTAIVTSLCMTTSTAMANVVEVCDVVMGSVRRTYLIGPAVVVVVTSLGRALWTSDATWTSKTFVWKLRLLMLVTRPGFVRTVMWLA